MFALPGGFELPNPSNPLKNRRGAGQCTGGMRAGFAKAKRVVVRIQPDDPNSLAGLSPHRSNTGLVKMTCTA